MKMVLFVGAVALASVALGCSSKGTCEFKFDEGSKDGSIPQGLEVCQPDWTAAEQCNAANMPMGGVQLKTSGFQFTKGTTCEERGYKDCSGGRRVAYYKTCPGK